MSIISSRNSPNFPRWSINIVFYCFPISTLTCINQQEEKFRYPLHNSLQLQFKKKKKTQKTTHHNSKQNPLPPVRQCREGSESLSKTHLQSTLMRAEPSHSFSFLLSLLWEKSRPFQTYHNFAFVYGNS